MSKYPLLVTLLLLAAIASFAWFELPHLTGVWQLLSWPLMVIGCIILLAAAGLFRRKNTTVDPTRPPDALVTSGLYRYSRNPMYLGMLLLLLGAALWVGVGLSLLSPLLFFIYANWLIIPQEEVMVLKTLGEPYRQYCQQTRRWL